MKKYFDHLAIIVLLMLSAVFFYQTLVFGKLPVPADALVGIYHPWRDSFAVNYPRGVPFRNFLITDPVRQQIPWRKEAIDQIKAGKVPFWNPYNFSGSPLHANIQAGVLYPLNFLFFLLNFPAAWTWLILLEIPLAGMFCYLLLRHYRVQPVFSLFGAVAWSYSGFIVAWLEWGTIVHVALWLPLILLSTDIVIEASVAHKNKKALMLLGLYSFSLVMQLLAGHIQISFYILMVSAMYACSRVFSLSATAKKKAVLFLLLGFAIMVVITSIQWIPFLSLVAQSARSTDLAVWRQPGWFIPWQNLIQFIVPDFFGNPATMNYWGVWNYAEFVGYIGIAPLLFALYAMVFRRDSQTKFFAGVVILGLMFALPNPISSLPFILHIPFISVMQPTRLLSVIDLALALLAALGIDHYFKSKKPIEYPIGFIGLILLGMWGVILLRGSLFTDPQLLGNLLISKRNLFLPTAYFFVISVIVLSFRYMKHAIWEKIGISLILAVTLFDLYRFGWKFLPFSEAKYFFPETTVTKFLKNELTAHPTQPFRTVSVDERLLPPNTETYFGYESVNGYDPIFLERYGEYVTALEHGKIIPTDFNRIITIHNYSSPLLSLLNVRYVMSLNEINNPLLRKVKSEGDTKVYEFISYLPRVFRIPHVVSRPKEDIFPLMLHPEFNPKTTALIEEASFPHSEEASSKDTLLVRSYSRGETEFSIQSRTDSFIFISQIYYPTWHATMDGLPLKIYRTDYIFQGVFIPSGNHEIKISNSLGI